METPRLLPTKLADRPGDRPLTSLRSPVMENRNGKPWSVPRTKKGSGRLSRKPFQIFQINEYTKM